MSEPERFVFGPFWNGETFVYGDPLELHRALVGHAHGRLNQLLEDSRVKGPEDKYDVFDEAGTLVTPGDTEEERANKQVLRDRANGVAFPAINEMMKVARLAFDMVPFDSATGKGALEADCHNVLNSFFDFISVEKKNPVQTPTSPEYSAPK